MRLVLVNIPLNVIQSPNFNLLALYDNIAQTYGVFDANTSSALSILMCLKNAIAYLVSTYILYPKQSSRLSHV